MGVPDKVAGKAKVTKANAKEVAATAAEVTRIKPALPAKAVKAAPKGAVAKAVAKVRDRAKK
jgi:hypothetical protein